MYVSILTLRKPSNILGPLTTVVEDVKNQPKFGSLPHTMFVLIEKLKQ